MYQQIDRRKLNCEETLKGQNSTMQEHDTFYLKYQGEKKCHQKFEGGFPESTREHMEMIKITKIQARCSGFHVEPQRKQGSFCRSGESVCRIKHELLISLHRKH